MIVTAKNKFALVMHDGKVWLCVSPDQRYELGADEAIALAHELTAMAEIAKAASHGR